MITPSPEWIGWVSTALTIGSYFCRNPRNLRLVQATGAVGWMSYGVAIASMPIIAANVLVAGVAVWSTFLGPGRNSPDVQPRDS
jgi:hypothetical protein